MFVRNAWYVAAWAGEIGERPFARRILNEPIVLFRNTSGAVDPRDAPRIHARRAVERLLANDGAVDVGHPQSASRPAG